MGACSVAGWTVASFQIVDRALAGGLFLLEFLEVRAKLDGAPLSRVDSAQHVIGFVELWLGFDGPA